MAKKSQPRQSRPRLSRPSAASHLAPTPVASGYNTPSSSAYPSTYASEDEDDAQPAKFDINTIPIHNLSLNEPALGATTAGMADEDAAVVAGELATTVAAATASEGDDTEQKGKGTEKQKAPVKPFPFLRLPSELRIKVYAYHFEGADLVADLSPDNFKRLFKKFFLLRTCRSIYREASHFYYSTHIFRVFPTYPGRFFKTRRPLLARLSQRQRSTINTMELRLGPGFNKPPKCWTVNKKLGLKDCINVRQLNVFVQLDPSVSWLDGFRQSGFYELFSRQLLDDILKETPSIEVVEFDAYESVRKNCPIMEELLQAARSHGKRITWGPLNGWTAAAENEANTAAAGKLNTDPHSLNRPISTATAVVISYDNPIMGVA